MSARFGPAGQCGQSKEERVKSTEQFLGYLAERGINAFEYQCGRGVTVGEDKCALFEQLGKAHGIAISLHAPYYISLASADEGKRLNSVEYILKSAAAVSKMGGNRIVVHPGGIGKLSRDEATHLAKETLRLALKRLDEAHLGHVHLCMETMGKINQLGNDEEVLAMCELDERMLPCVDFGHMNARTHGGMNGREAFNGLLRKVENCLGRERKNRMHMHFSKIEYSEGGEVRHLTFEDTVFGPSYEPLLDLIFEQNMEPVLICESAGTQTRDALQMKQYYEALGEG